jgi:hypothetical protein
MEHGDLKMKNEGRVLKRERKEGADPRRKRERKEKKKPTMLNKLLCQERGKIYVHPVICLLTCHKFLKTISLLNFFLRKFL